MIKLSDEYKIETAEKLTELAIQNNYISKYSEEEEAAKSICTFFKTVFENLDS